MSRPTGGDALDRDTAAVVESLRTAVTTSGLTQAAFATALGTSGPRLSSYLRGTVSPSARTLLRAHRLARALSGARALGLMSAPATAAAVRRHLREGDEPWAWRALLQGRDHLRLLLQQASGAAVLAADPLLPRALPTPGTDLVPAPPFLLDAWEAAPASTSHPGWDTLLAACTAHEHEAAGHEVPVWAVPRPLPEPWLPPHPFLSPDRVRTQTPPWLQRLNVFVPRRDLTTA
ncbi:helix-turn-helix domain-containing protein [Kineococcus sp. SYSU DK004]|uniref:helix-turn-helix domain-containing protein n=1 Tax=Kineococcus sp. SYSU DK004 TaxID=3383125 RepID=UPI003D7E9B80